MARFHCDLTLFSALLSNAVTSGNGWLIVKLTRWLVSFGGGMMLQEFGGVSFDAGHELVTDWWVQADRSACNYISPSPGPIWTILTRWFRLRSTTGMQEEVGWSTTEGERVTEASEMAERFFQFETCAWQIWLLISEFIFFSLLLVQIVDDSVCDAVVAPRICNHSWVVMCGGRGGGHHGCRRFIVLCPLFWECVKLFLRLRLDTVILTYSLLQYIKI